MINSRGLLFVFLTACALLMLAGKARSADSPRLPAGVTCNDIRQHVQRYGYWPALLWAKANGFSKDEIEAAKRCLQK